MASKTIDGYRNNTEIVKGDAECKKKLVQLLEELSLAKGLFPLENVEEFGYNRNVGFIWFIQKKKIETLSKRSNKWPKVSYAPEVMAFVEKGKVNNISGVKTKELLIWLSVVEVYIEEGSKEKVTFKKGTGLFESFDVSAFVLLK